MSRTYVCEGCGGTYEASRDEQAVKDEALSLWGSQCEGPMAVVCDSCFEFLLEKTGKR